ncbi:hypothetical protein [Xanthobacter sp. 126]|uniref:hypothetical protein n=1 Tax=Xanthobacter sp. 126 TaxID=1131814 RepID=UPI00045EBAB0|nr:hypothetical protein [Xanthobacter sp. 126]
MALDFDDDEDAEVSRYKTIGWRGKGARLKNYSSATKMGGPGIIKIEIETFDSFTMDDLVKDLERIEAREKKEKAAAARLRASKPRRELPAPPLQLTYRGDE